MKIDITPIEQVRMHLLQCLEHEKERKKVRTLVRLTLDQFHGKKITKGIEKKLEDALPGYLITYFVELYSKKVTIRRRHGGNKEVFAETIMVHSDHFGEFFSMPRFLDIDADMAYIFQRITELETTLEGLDEKYPVLVQQLNDFIEVQQKFREDMNAFRSLLPSLSESEHNYIREHTKW
jgi:hypothetical protein